ncbi:MAG: hypothetical protein Q9223_004957 [Gallowayella weberi]
MSLARHVDPDTLIQALHDHPSKAHKHHFQTKSATSTVTPYSSRYASQQEISKFVIPQQGAPADAVHQMLKDELDLDGRPNLNLARYPNPSAGMRVEPADKLLLASLELIWSERQKH